MGKKHQTKKVDLVGFDKHLQTKWCTPQRVDTTGFCGDNSVLSAGKGVAGEGVLAGVQWLSKK